ncbi:MAG: hypothetical protein AVDCRST_MAG67-3236 [uncultured Solirubrobacteraceae bacterium]|uniref:Uncharacterized protein n=1 Tax=uncultured Solirubrobacteraceae bacterium TaxID=1162706 RepID=A0A6J4TBQ2_9ACTN|nr:MAG: hypothetical protein AVDCRST_MAG67-3236 [uncultured Solirubrobacteraceae bacterium]
MSAIHGQIAFAAPLEAGAAEPVRRDVSRVDAPGSLPQVLGRGGVTRCVA